MPLFSQDKKVAALKRAPLFADLSRKELTELAKVTDVSTSTGQGPVQGGPDRSRVLRIMEGEVEITRRGKKLATGGSGEFFGEIALVEKLPGPQP